MKRPRLKTEEKQASYFVGTKAGIKFVSSGCTLLDCALGNGYPLGRIVNIVGDRSTAKTALATEALANFVEQYPEGKAAYRDAEAAFDVAYAKAMNIPVDKIDFGDPEKPLLTVEDFARDFDAFLTGQITSGKPGIYVLDSLDALSDEAELEEAFGKPSFGAKKAKMLSALFRQMARKTEQGNVLLLIVSQVRDNIGVMFGEKHKRSGGRALDFYASQALWLAHTKTLKRTINRVERPYGIKILGKIKKNKVGLPFREVSFEFHFGYGVADVEAGVEWLKEVGRLDDIGVKETAIKRYVENLGMLSNGDYKRQRDIVSQAVKTAWADIETDFLPIRKKYTQC